MKSFTKIKKFRILCKECHEIFNSGVVQAKYCDRCKTREHFCGCGCETKVKGLTRYARGHGTKGKTYKQIYGLYKTKAGYQRGGANIAKRGDIRKRISAGVKKSYNKKLLEIRREQGRKNIFGASFGKFKFNNSLGERFRSTLERDFSEWLLVNKYTYEYEKRIKLKDGSIKVVDFVVNDIFIEITGYAYKNWQLDFNKKIKKLREVVDNPILILTYREKLQLAWGGLSDTDIFIHPIEDRTDTKKTINHLTNLIDLKGRYETFCH